jgi:hypothetical protein
MLIFNSTIHNLWGRVLVKYPETRIRSLPSPDDGYIKDMMSVVYRS